MEICNKDWLWENETAPNDIVGGHLQGEYHYSNKHRWGASQKGKQALVVGACSSVHDVSFHISYCRLFIDL